MCWAPLAGVVTPEAPVSEPELPTKLFVLICYLTIIPLRVWLSAAAALMVED
jgi:hypothetical protein